MRLPSWQQIIARLSRPAARSSSARDRMRRDFARLSIRRLEDRRVLNGTPVGMGVTISDARGALVVDASQASPTSQRFDVSLQEKEGRIELELTDNGTILYENEIDKIASVTFRASADNVALVVDFANGDPIPVGGITFAAAGPAQPGGPGDSLQFVNGTLDHVAYTLSSPTDGQVNFAAGSQNSSIQFSGAVETVTDQLSSATRSFAIGAAVSQARLAADGQVAGLSQFGVGGGTTVDFAAPTNSVAVNSDSSGTTLIDVHGLSTGFDANLTIRAGGHGTVGFSASTNVGSGNLNVMAGSIAIDAPVTTSGGTIELSATEKIVVAPAGGLATTGNAIGLSAGAITQNGVITAADGGKVRLDAGANGTLIDSGLIDASSKFAGGTGGSVDLLGKDVGLTGNAVVNVAGSSGGGSVRIGGDFHGANGTIENAAHTYVGKNVTIDADAIDSGTGGRVVVWSDEATVFYGHITARGGAAAGNGGEVEISSQQNLAEHGVVDLSAAHGVLGSLLLDPQTITIVDAGTPPPYDDSQLPVVVFSNSQTANFTITEAALEASTANILLQARNSIVVGNLTNGPGTLTLENNVSITLQTRNDSTRLDSATGGIILSTIHNSLNIQTRGNGTITIEGGVNADANGVVSSHQGSADVSVALLQTQGGAITIVASRDINVLGNVSTISAAANVAGGTISLTADSTEIGAGTLTIGTGNLLTVETGGGALTATSALFDMKADASINTINAGNAALAGQLALNTTNNRNIYLGNNDPNNSDYVLGAAATLSMAAGNLVVGGIGAGNITVDATTALFNIHGLVSLLATDGNHGITFQGSGVVFSALNAQANDGIAVNANITAVSGSLFLEGDADGAANSLSDTPDSQAQITFGGGGSGRTLTAENGSITLQAAGGGMSAAGALTLNASGGVTLNNNLTTVGPLTINADSDMNGVGTFTLAVNAQVTTGNNPISISSADIALAGMLNAGNATTTLLATGNRTVGIGTLPPGTTDYMLDATELSHITTGNLTIGQAAGTTTNGSIVVGTFVASEIAGIGGTVSLNARGHAQSVSFSGTDIIFPALAVSADNGIAFTAAGATLTTNGNLSLNADANNVADGAAAGHDAITFVSGMTLKSTAGSITLKARSGGMSAAGALELDAATGVTVSDSLTTLGALTVNAGGNGLFTIDNNNPPDAVISSQGNPLTITAAGFVLATHAELSDIGGTITLQTTGGRTIGLGSATGAISLSNNILNQITAANLIIGGAGAGNIAVDGTSAAVAPAVANVTLDATDPGRTVTFLGTSAATFHSLQVESNAGIIVNAGIVTGGGTTAAGDNSSGNLSLSVDLNATANAITFAAGAVVKSAASLTLTDLVASGSFTGAGGLTLTAVNGITLANSLTTAGTTIIINADNESVANDEVETPNSGSVHQAAGTVINTTNGALTLVFGHLDLQGTINTGNANTTLAPTDGETIGLGSGAGDIRLTEAQLQTITSGSLTIGGAMTGSISVADVLATGQQGAVTLNAGLDGAMITFGATGNTFTALTAQANDGIQVLGNVTTTTGDLQLNGDSDTGSPQDSGDANEKIVFSPGVTLVAAGNLTLQAAGGGLTYSGNLTLTAANSLTLLSSLLATSGGSILTMNAGNGITLNGNVTTTGTLTANADDENGVEESEGTAVSGAFTVVLGATVNTNNNPLTVTSENLILAGNLNSGTAATTLLVADGLAINIGAAGTGFNLTGAELKNIAAAELDVGSAASGNIAVNGVTAAQTASIGTVVLNASGTGNTILFTGSGSQFRGLSGTADSDITVNAPIEIVPSAATSVGDLLLKSSHTLTVNSSLMTDTVTPPGAVGTLQISPGVIRTVNSSIIVGTGNITLTSAGGLLDFIVSRDLSPIGVISANTIDLEAFRDVIVDAPLITTRPAADVNLIADSRASGVGGVWITSNSTNHTVGSVDSAGNVTIQGSKLYGQEFSASPPTGAVVIDAGSTVTAAGQITINGGPAAPSGVDVVIHGAIASTGGSIDITASNKIETDTSLSTSGGAITFHSPVILNGATSVTSNVASPRGGNIEFQSTVDSAASTGNSLTLTAGSGSVEFDGAVGMGQSLGALVVNRSGNFVESLGIIAASFDVNSAGNITLNGNVTTTGTFQANADADVVSSPDSMAGDDTAGAGTFTIAAAKSVTTNGNALSIIAADVNLAGTIDSGAAATTIGAADGETVGVGTAVGTMTLDTAELSRITSGSLTIGGSATGSITISGVTNAASGNVGAVTLKAGVDGAMITFGSTPSTFIALTASANDGILVQGNVTTSSGNLALNGDADTVNVADIGDTHENIIIDSGITLQSAGGIALQAAGRGISALGLLDLVASNGVDIRSNLTSSGPLQVNADSNANGTGTFLVESGVTVNTQGNQLIASAASVNLLGSINSSGGAVIISATPASGAGPNFGAIFMADGAVIDAGSGPIVLTAKNDITLGRLVTTKTGPVSVSVATSKGAIINGGNTAGENVTAAALELEAATGIGSAVPLQTAVSKLVSVNSTSGNVQIANNAGGLLTIGTVGNESGVHNAGGGSISLENVGPVNVGQDVLDVGGGDITIGAANSGDLTVNAHIRATGGNGNIFLNAGENLHVANVAAGPQIETQGSGQIIGVAQSLVVFDPGILIQSGVGAITALSPTLSNVALPELTAQGNAIVTGMFGEPGANNFTVIVNWSDGTPDSRQQFLNTSSGSFSFTHHYVSNPNPLNQAQPIPVIVTIFDDPNSTFIGLQQPPVSLKINATDTQTTANGSQSVQTQTTIPGTGIEFLNIAQVAIVISSLQYTPPNTLALSPVIRVPQVIQTSGVEETVHVFESTNVEERQVVLRVLDANGNVLESVTMDEAVLDDLPKLFGQLPDGHYEVYLKEPGEVQLRLLLDITLRGGKPTDEGEAEQDKPPAGDAPAVDGLEAPTSGILPKAADQNWLTFEGSTFENGLPACVAARIVRALLITNVVPTHEVEPQVAASDELFAVAAQSESCETDSDGRAAAILAGSACVASVARGNWECRVDAALAEADSAALSKAARLARRVQRPLARRLVSRRRGR